MNTEPNDSDPNPSLRGIYANPDGTHETGDPDEAELLLPPASEMNSGVDPFRRDDALATPSPDQVGPDEPDSRDNDPLATNPIQPKVTPKD